jgi:Arsenical resistance operon protein ArsD
MTVLQVFDPPMFCSSGVCGASVDPKLPRLAADLDWLRSQGVQVERYNLAHQPQAFVAQEDVKSAIRADPNHALPLVRVNGHIVSKGIYPSRQMLAAWCGISVLDVLPATDVKSCGSVGCG